MPITDLVQARQAPLNEELVRLLQATKPKDPSLLDISSSLGRAQFEGTSLGAQMDLRRQNQTAEARQQFSDTLQLAQYAAQQGDPNAGKVMEAFGFYAQQLDPASSSKLWQWAENLPDDVNASNAWGTFARGVQELGLGQPEAEAPKTREVKVGDQIITEEWNAETGEYEAIAQGDRFAPPDTTTINNLMGDMESSFMEELGEKDAETASGIREAGLAANMNLGNIDRMELAIQSGKFTPGVFAEARQFGAQLAEFVGAEELVSLFGDAATADTLDAASKDLAVTLAQDLSRMTNMSLGFIEDSLPGLMRTPEGNLILLETMRRTEDRKAERAQMLDRYIREYGSLYPPDQPSYWQTIADLESADPIINDELRQRIIEGSRDAPKTWGDVVGETELAPSLPDGSRQLSAAEVSEYTLPDGSPLPPGEYWVTPDGRLLQKEQK